MIRAIITAVLIAASFQAFAQLDPRKMVAAAPKSAETQMWLFDQPVPGSIGTVCPRGRLAARDGKRVGIGCWWDMGNTIEFLWFDRYDMDYEEPQVIPRSSLIWIKQS